MLLLLLLMIFVPAFTVTGASDATNASSTTSTTTSTSPSTTATSNTRYSSPVSVTGRVGFYPDDIQFDDIALVPDDTSTILLDSTNIPRDNSYTSEPGSDDIYVWSKVRLDPSGDMWYRGSSYNGLQYSGRLEEPLSAQDASVPFVPRHGWNIRYDGGENYFLNDQKCPLADIRTTLLEFMSRAGYPENIRSDFADEWLGYQPALFPTSKGFNIIITLPAIEQIDTFMQIRTRSDMYDTTRAWFVIDHIPWAVRVNISAPDPELIREWGDNDADRDQAIGTGRVFEYAVIQGTIGSFVDERYILSLLSSELYSLPEVRSSSGTLDHFWEHDDTSDDQFIQKDPIKKQIVGHPITLLAIIMLIGVAYLGLKSRHVV